MAHRPTLRRLVLATAFLFPGLALSNLGCNVLAKIGGTDTVDLHRATIRQMTIALRNADQTICPRAQVQMAVVVSAVPEGGKEPQTFETWAGRGDVNKNGKLDFVDFTFQSDQGQFDKDGWFAPLQSIQATAGHEFVVHSIYNPNPTLFSYTQKWKPGYGCITDAALAGLAGTPGGPGKDAGRGKIGDAGGVMSAGGDGQDGPQGGAGLEGTKGGHGPKIHAVATYVKTPFYEKLIAVRLTGDLTDFLLVEPGRPFTIHARGGAGGPGGPGGKGGAGGDGAQGNPGGRGGNGGLGGAGGRGGEGGPGGTIELVTDARFPELAAAFTLDAAGGPGGPGGPAGVAGPRGEGGKGINPQNSPGNAPDGVKGREGYDGQPGAVGRPGPNGTASSHPGSIGDAFAGIPDVTVLGTPAGTRGAR